MKRTLLILLTICSLNIIGQEKLKIEIDNPEPRVGQSVKFSINVDFLTNYFKGKFGKNVDFTRTTSIFGFQSDDFERVIIFEKAKKYKIGPFNFEFNGKKYSTEIITVNVLEKLPLKNGLWLRLTKNEGQQYLILEQLIGNESDKINNENGGYSHTVGGVKPKGKEFAELKKELIEGIELSNHSSSTYTMKPENAELFDNGFSYSMIKYKIKISENYDGKYKISETDFENLPETFDIGKIKIKK